MDSSELGSCLVTLLPKNHLTMPHVASPRQFGHILGTNGIVICKLHKYKWFIWCPEGDLNPHDLFRSADFKFAVSADFTIRARQINRISLPGYFGA